MIWKMTTTSPTTPPALQVRGLCKRYAAEPASVDVLKGIELELAPAAFEAVMGSSGSGKSTLLHLLAGLLSADEGEIIIGGESITGMDDETATIFRRRRIGLVFQDFNLIRPRREEHTCRCCWNAARRIRRRSSRCSNGWH